MIPLRDGARDPGDRPFFGRVESLRGLGAMAVAGYHISGWGLHGAVLLPESPWPGSGAMADALRRLGLLLMPGHGALMVFFVVSGLVLRLSLDYGPQESGRAALRFFVARLFRIYPIVAAAVGVSLLLNGWTVPPRAAGLPPAPLDLGTLAANLLLIDVSINTTWWALQVEVLMAPVIFLLWRVERRFGTGVLAAVAAVTAVLSFDQEWALWPPLSHNVYPFVLGMLVPTLGRAVLGRLSPRGLAISAAIAVAELVVPHRVLGMYSLWSAAIEAHGALVLVTSVAYFPALRGAGVLDRRLLRLVGAASGSYYVLHPIVAPTAMLLAATIVPAAWPAAAPAAVGWGVIAAWLLALVPVAVLGFHAVEAPGIALGRLVHRLVAGRPAADLTRTAPAASRG